MAFDFSGKKILVTGAARGIGRGIAVSLAEAGCKVYALDCNKDNLAILKEEHSNIETILQDLSNWDETRSTLEKLDALDGLVNDAAVFHGICPALEQTRELLQEYMSVNLLAYITCIQIIGKKMIAAEKKGSVVNISSVLSQSSWSGYLGYAVAKSGVEMVTKQFALELGPHNIRVNSVNPTMVKTEINDALPEDGGIEREILRRTPMERVALVEEVVGPVMYLLSEHAAMVTGTSHIVDGGMLANITTKR